MTGLVQGMAWRKRGGGQRAASTADVRSCCTTGAMNGPRPSLATASGDAADQRLLVIESLALGAPSFAKSQDVNMIVSLGEHACTGHFSVPHGSTPHRSETTVRSDGGNRSTWALPVPAGSAPRVPLGRVATAPTDDSLIARIDILGARRRAMAADIPQLEPAPRTELAPIAACCGTVLACLARRTWAEPAA